MNDVTEQSIVEHSFLVQINYKSGQSIKAWFDKFDVKHQGGDLTSLSWTVSGGNNERILFIGMDNIESIVQLKFKDRNEVVAN